MSCIKSLKDQVKCKKNSLDISHFLQPDMLLQTCPTRYSDQTGYMQYEDAYEESDGVIDHEPNN